MSYSSLHKHSIFVLNNQSKQIKNKYNRATLSDYVSDHWSGDLQDGNTYIINSVDDMDALYINYIAYDNKQNT